MPVRALTIAALVAAWALVFEDALAADLPVPPVHHPPASVAPASTSPGTTANDLEGADAACREWTDGCRVCARADDNKFACSNLGIACQPAQGRCTRR